MIYHNRGEHINHYTGCFSQLGPYININATDLAATDLEDGVYRVYTVDIAGNVSTASTTTVTIDTSSPTAPISLDLANEDDSGSSNSDNLTS
jgi:hypothetical protein